MFGLRLIDGPAYMGDKRHGWLRKYKTGATHLILVTVDPETEEEIETDYMALDHSPSGYTWPFGTILYFQPQTVMPSVTTDYPDETRLHFGFVQSQPYGYSGAEYAWIDENTGNAYVIGDPSGAWLYMDAMTGRTWRALTGRVTVPGEPDDAHYTVWAFERFGVFNLDAPTSGALPRDMIIHQHDADLGPDFWVEAATASGAMVTGYFLDVEDYTAYKSITLTGTPGSETFSITTEDLFTEHYNVWNTTSSTGTAENPVFEKYVLHATSGILDDTAITTTEVAEVSVSGNDQEITITPSGHADSVCTQSATRTLTSGAESWIYPVSITVTDAYTVTSATETETSPGIWIWSITVRVDRTYDIDFNYCPGADNSYTKTTYATLSNTGAGRVADAFVDYNFITPVYVWDDADKGKVFDAPVSATATRRFFHDYSWQGYGGTLRGPMERCQDTTGGWAKYRRGKMLASNLVIAAGDWTTTTKVQADEFTFDPVTGVIKEEVGPLDYYWVASI